MQTEKLAQAFMNALRKTAELYHDYGSRDKQLPIISQASFLSGGLRVIADNLQKELEAVKLEDEREKSDSVIDQYLRSQTEAVKPQMQPYTDFCPHGVNTKWSNCGYCEKAKTKVENPSPSIDLGGESFEEFISKNEITIEHVIKDDVTILQLSRLRTLIAIAKEHYKNK